jgi:ABC-2 type transport system ATP-binding protein
MDWQNFSENGVKPEEKMPSNREVIASLRDVTVTYDGYLTRALTRVNLDFRVGEVTAVLGAKGAGKSTTLKVLAGRLRPTEGAAKLFGRSPRRGATKARVGYLPGKTDTAHRPGFFARLFRQRNEAPSPARGAARLTQAILGNRDLLILDDPFADLGAAELTDVKALIRDMISRGKTVILSSDSLMQVKDICQRLVILHEGKLQAVGTLDELLAGGEAIRLMPAVLPPEIVERVLAVLRQEISAPVSREKSSNTPQTTALGDSIKAPAADPLSPLTKPVESAPVAPSVKKDDAIDHEKLEGLVKPAKPE